jgi:LmbE family N-acetylglucosaminyl deacetylase
VKYFLSPHNDDETLFGAFTLIREKPQVKFILHGYVQQRRGASVTWRERMQESSDACDVLGVIPDFWHYRDDQPEWDAIHRELTLMEKHAEVVYAPAYERDGHDHHNRIGELADHVFGSRVVHYMTYTKAGKSTGVQVPYEPEWVLLKLKAMACYESQIRLPSCMPHFTRGLEEYYQG